VSLSEYIFLAASSLFVIVDPLATVPAFLAMTPSDTPEERMRMARLACCVMAGVLIVFAAAGKWIFKFLGITMPAFQLAASIVLLLVALDMLRAQRSRVQETREETAAGAEKTDIAVAPLAIPMLAGPGSISTVMVLMGGAPVWWYAIPIFVAIAITAVASFWTLAAADRVRGYLGETGIRILTRMMGLLLTAIAVQFVINGLTDIGLVRPSP